MKKFVVAVGILLVVGALQAAGNGLLNMSDVQNRVTDCARKHKDNSSNFTACMADVLVPTINAYVNLATRNPQEGKKVAADLSKISWRNEYNALPYRTGTDLPQFLNYSFNVDGMNRAIYKTDYPYAVGEQVELNKPWDIVQKHLFCAKNPDDYKCSKPLPQLQRVGKNVTKKLKKKMNNTKPPRRK